MNTVSHFRRITRDQRRVKYYCFGEIARLVFLQHTEEYRSSLFTNIKSRLGNGGHGRIEQGSCFQVGKTDDLNILGNADIQLFAYIIAGNGQFLNRSKMPRGRFLPDNNLRKIGQLNSQLNPNYINRLAHLFLSLDYY